MVGQRFGRLTVLKQVESHKHGYRWLCQCDCGNLTTVRGINLRSSNTRSCGCLKWKGENASIKVIHLWLAKNKPRPELCERCRERPVEQLSYNNMNKRGYSRNLDDYEWLCTSCHALKDRGSGAIMTKARIHRIREFYKCGAATQQKLAALFKVDRITISNIIHYRKLYQKLINPKIFKDLIKNLRERR